MNISFTFSLFVLFVLLFDWGLRTDNRKTIVSVLSRKDWIQGTVYRFIGRTGGMGCCLRNLDGPRGTPISKGCSFFRLGHNTNLISYNLWFNLKCAPPPTQQYEILEKKDRVSKRNLFPYVQQNEGENGVASAALISAFGPTPIVSIYNFLPLLACILFFTFSQHFS